MQNFAQKSTAKSNLTEDGKKLHEKREEYQVNISRNSRQDILKKMRPNLNDEKNITDRKSTQNVGPEQLRAHVDNCLKKHYTINDFMELVQHINSNDVFNQHYGVIGLRKILSVEDGPPIQMVIDSNLIPRLLEFVRQDEYPHLQLESAWALTNVASGTSHQTQAIIDKGGIPSFTKLLSSSHNDIAEQAIWALGNIAGDCAIYRDMILKCGGLDPLIKIIENSTNKSTIKHGSWALSNLCRGRPLPNFDLVKNAIPTLAKVMKTEQDSEVLTDAAWALSYLSDGDEQRIELVIKTGVIQTLISLLDHPFLSILIPTLRTLGNIVTGNDVQTNEVLKFNALEKFFQLLNNEKRAVRREACWTLSNITAGNAEQISLIVNRPDYVEKLISLMMTDCLEIKREAAWVLSNATSQGAPQDVQKLVQMGLLDKFVDMLDSDDVKTLAVVLEALNNILKCGKQNFCQTGENIFALKLEALGAVDKIEKLQSHPNDDVYLKALKILENYFELEDII